MWHVGQRVVCVDDSTRTDKYVKIPMKGGIYTIREIDMIGGTETIMENEDGSLLQ